MAIYRQIVEVTDTEATADAIRGTGFNWSLLETLPNGHSIVEFWCSDDPSFKPSEQHGMADMVSKISGMAAFVRLVPTHKASPATMATITKSGGVVVATG